jgi:ribosome maturation factor RimP
MSTVDLVVERVRTVALPLIESQGMTLVDVEFRREARGWVLRLYLDRPEGIRVLKTPQDFMRFAGRLARLETAAPIGGQRRFRGRLEGYREGMVILRQAEGPTLLLPLEAIVKARLEAEL